MGLKKCLAENARRLELLDKMTNMQEKSDKMLMELELKRTRLYRRKANGNGCADAKRRERISAPSVESTFTK